MAITYKSAGAGVATETSAAALSPANPAVVDAGDILLLFTAWEGTTSAPSPDGTWTLLEGPENVGTASVVARCWLYGKIAAGTEDGATNALGSPAVTTQRCARIFSFAGRTSGTITELITVGTPLTGDTDPTGPSVTTQAAGGLAAAFVYQHDNNTLETFAGASDTWTERGTVGGYIFALTPGGVIDLLTATPAADPGTVSGGAMTVTNDPWTVIGVAIDAAPSLPALDTKNVTDSCAVQASDTVVATVLIAPVDTCAVQAGDVGTSTPILILGIPLLITETANVLYLFTVTDACVIQAAESTAPSAQALPTDSCAIQATESSIIQASANIVESCAVQADEAAAVTSTVVASDSCAIVASETASIVSTVSSSESCTVQISETASVVTVFEDVAKAVTDTCAVQASEVASITATVSAFDSLAVQIASELVTLISDSAAESCTIQLDEAAVITVVVTATDTCAVQADEVGSMEVLADALTLGIPLIIGDEVAQINWLWLVLDSPAVQAAEVAALAVTAAASESLAIQASEVAVIVATLATTDSCAVQATEETGIAATASADDSAAVQADEAASIAATVSTSETCAVVLTETASVVITEDVLEVSATDACAIAASEASAISATGTVLDQAAVGLTEEASILATVSADDSVAVVLDETAALAPQEVTPIAATDSCTVVVSEVASTTVTVETSDACVIQAAEVLALAPTVLASDSATAQLVEDLLASVSANAVADLVLGLTEDLLIDGAASFDDSLAMIAEDVTIAAGEFVGVVELVVTDTMAIVLDETVTAPVVPAEIVAVLLLESVTLVQREVQGFWEGGWIAEPAPRMFAKDLIDHRDWDVPTGETW